MRNNKNVSKYVFGRGAIEQLGVILSKRRNKPDEFALFLVDHFFESNELITRLPVNGNDTLIYLDTTEEPKTSAINDLYQLLKDTKSKIPFAIIGIGGGTTLDTAKAISNLFTNEGKAEEYQGWDLVRRPGVYKLGIPTLSGTGAESSRTCVMTNPKNGLKLGMNSDYSVYDQLILDPDLSRSVPRKQYFYSGIDTYIHCIESLNGAYRNPIGDAFSREALSLSKEVFSSEDMMMDANRQKLMVASYLGGCAIAHSYVGMVHPFSAGLSVVLGIHHGLANCIALCALEAFYPEEVDTFRIMAEKQGVNIPEGVCSQVSDNQLSQLYHATICHEKPLSNALGENFKSILIRQEVFDLFGKM